jgi:Fe-S-cluster containining protein
MQKMVAGSAENGRLSKEVAEIYDWLEIQIAESNTKGQCKACGECCDLEGFDHRLFITPPELMYLKANLGDEKIKPMPTGRCPYNVKGRCTVYEYRFAACRIFCCCANEDFQSRLSETTLKKLKSLCEELQILYRYSDLANALNSFVDY